MSKQKQGSSDQEILKGKRVNELNYKKQARLLDYGEKLTILELLKAGAVCELRQQQSLSNGAQTITIKIYFEE